jgi:RHS repeat-associated protein
MPQLSEKPRLGFATKKTAWNPGPNVCNFTVTLGLRATVVENGVRKTYSARYYNPNTGRFLSRDPKEFKPLESKNKPVDSSKLHRYLYAVGDPVNRIDPRGREDEEEEGFLYTEIGPTTEEIKKFIAGPVLCAFAIDAYLISLRDGGNALDNTLGGAGTAAGCAVLLAGW